MSEPSGPSRQIRLDLTGKGGIEHLAGVIQRVTFHNEESGFCVLRLKLTGVREAVTVVGRAPRVAPGEFVEAEGRWGQNKEYGRQFEASELRIKPPTTRDGMERYLGSGLVHGVGPALAKRLVAAFGEDVFSVIDEEPERLREVEGVGSVRSQRIVAAWAEQKRVRDIMVFLHSHRVGTARAVQIQRAYGADALEKIRREPYGLARDVRGIGFATADALARSLGFEATAAPRLRAGVRHVLGEAVASGHCGLPEVEVLAEAQRLLDVDPSRIGDALDAEVASGDLVRDAAQGVDCVFLAGLYGAERSAARQLVELARGRPPWPAVDPDVALPWVQSHLGITLAESQRSALGTALEAKVLVMTGGPGVGKTTLVRALLAILEAKGVRAQLAAPTGRAAKRLAESTGREAKTLHRLLETNPRTGGFKRGAEHPIEGDLLVVDECSMVDVPLLFALAKAVPPEAGLLLIGDVDQLPSVGPGQVLRDVIDSGAVPVVRLVEVFRQAERSGIVRAAHHVNRGELPDLEPRPDGDFFFIAVEDPEVGAERVVKVVRDRIPARFGLDPIADVQVLCPMRRGVVGANALNLTLRDALNAADGSAASVERFGIVYGVGDKVMQTENDYDKEVYNGDLGRVSSVDEETREVVVRFDERDVTYAFEELDSLSLAYATTVHKAQGSEYRAVVMPLFTQHYTMLKRNLLYTGITRGRELVVLVGQRRALEIAVRDEGDRRRFSKLRDWLAPPRDANEF